MSLLLEALRKADREREGSNHPAGLDTAHTPASTEPNRVNLLLIALAVAVVLLLALVLWLTLRASPPNAVTTEPPAPAVKPLEP
ncbi:hypothetical protein KO507_04615, partial [Gilvimarinus agarilyticus]